MARKLTLKQLEKTPQDRAKDRALAKRGIKEGSPKDIAADKKLLTKLNKGRK